MIRITTFGKMLDVRNSWGKMMFKRGYQKGYRVGRLYETNQFKKHIRIMNEQTGLEHKIG